MIESLIEITLVGLITGFVFSVPVTGPIGILTISKTLQNQRLYAVLAATGAAVVDVLYCFIAVFGFMKLVSAYSYVIPYILMAGSAVIVFIAIRIYRTKLDIEHLDETRVSQRQPKIRKRGALFTGFMINFLNPTLFFGWLTSSFIAMSFVASIGLDVADFKFVVDESKNGIENLTKENVDTQDVKPEVTAAPKTETETKKPTNKGKHQFLFSLVFAIFLGIGTIIWFYLFTGIISKYRKRMKIPIVNKVIKYLGIILVLFGVYIFMSACVAFNWFAWDDLYGWLI